MSENELEQYTLELLQTLGWEYKESVEVKHLRGGKLDNVVLESVLKDSLARLNPSITSSQIDQVALKIKNLEGSAIIDRNKQFCYYLRHGVKVSEQKGEDEIGKTIKIFDYETPTLNSLICTNQFTIINNRETKRADVVLIVNGLPIVVIELKNATDESATIENAYHQLQTYKTAVSQLFDYNALMVISDGLYARMGSVTAGFDRFLAWKSIDGSLPSNNLSQIEILTKGLLNPKTILDVIYNYTLFEQISKEISGVTTVSFAKKVCASHQYYAVNKALESTKKARLTDRKAGVIWHTQGSGKSLSMVFYAGKVVQNMDNPTIVVITDRSDLDQQLFETFGNCVDILGQKPVNAGSRSQLKEILKTTGGGIVFTTIQKFEESGDCLCDRDNIIVIADEAHRSQYGFGAKENSNNQLVFGYAKYLRDALPNASYIGFTGTPIESDDKSTMGVFGEYIDIYDIRQAVEDGATVPIYYESRVIKFDISESEKILLDKAVDEVLEGVEDELSEKLKKQGLNLETVVGNTDRVSKVALDIVSHYESRQTVLNGKSMVVCISRTVAVEMMNQIKAIRPDWFDNDITKGKIKLVMSDVNSSEANYTQWSEYLTKKPQREELARRLKDPQDELQIVIVVDMWLTGFDAPCLHTLYIDKIMKTHNLMQAIARVNRVFGNKPGGLVVDYIGIASKLKQAMQLYTNSGGQGEVKIDQSVVLEELEDQFSVIDAMFFGMDYSGYYDFNVSQKLSLLRSLTDHILGMEKGKKRFLDNLAAFNKIIALAMPNARAIELSKSLVVFQSIKTFLQKLTVGSNTKTESELTLAIKQLVDQSLETGEVIDLFEVSGVSKPKMGILSEEFLADIRGNKHKNLALETLKKLLANEIKSRSTVNITQTKKFSEALSMIINRYHNNLLDSTEIIEELINLAKEIKEKDQQDQKLGLTDYEIAFYDALCQNNNAKEIMKQETLGQLASALVIKIQESSKIDWNNRSDAQAKMRLIIKNTLKRYGYPPDMEQLAIDTILEQTKTMMDNRS